MEPARLRIAVKLTARFRTAVGKSSAAAMPLTRNSWEHMAAALRVAKRVIQAASSDSERDTVGEAEKAGLRRTVETKTERRATKMKPMETLWTSLRPALGTKTSVRPTRRFIA
ncbi:hypothetical protein QR680_005724 [Steinernema hermaphroditum]|uniref:Uncharacterized protein n=1 Tax=Steinernema hermaphroditum TaxID=289476 RepID=A0AA39HT57_9BILA|nr:hypothetical protein QR680_005724 [Steinernema hermaphroditum]